MAFKRKNEREPIAGFWTRVGVMEGTIVKYKAGKDKKSSYFLFRVTQQTPCVSNDEHDDGTTVQVTRTAEIGEIIGVADCSALECIAKEPVGKLVRIESNGKKPTKDGKNQFWDFAVFTDEDSDDENVPF